MPGTQLCATTSDNRIPLLIIQKTVHSPFTPAIPGSDSRPISGFTVLVPRGWSMYLLSSFVYAGCMIGGLVERRNQYREAGIPSFPEHYGDVCRAGRDWEAIKADEEKARWDKKPPAKRPQFSVLGTTSPWKADWNRVLAPPDEESLMNGSELTNKPWLFTGPIRPFIDVILTRKEGPSSTLSKIVNTYRYQRNIPDIPSSASEGLYASALVHIRLEVECRGSPGDVAIIYSISAEERNQWLAAKERDARYGRADWDQDEPKREMQKVSPSTSYIAD